MEWAAMGNRNATGKLVVRAIRSRGRLKCLKITVDKT
jgi:hypothetical protein